MGKPRRQNVRKRTGKKLKSKKRTGKKRKQTGKGFKDFLDGITKEYQQLRKDKKI